MNFIKLPFAILNKERLKMDFIKGFPKRRVPAEIESYINSLKRNKRDTN